MTEATELLRRVWAKGAAAHTTVIKLQDQQRAYFNKHHTIATQQKPQVTNDEIAAEYKRIMAEGTDQQQKAAQHLTENCRLKQQLQIKERSEKDMQGYVRATTDAINNEFAGHIEQTALMAFEARDQNELKRCKSENTTLEASVERLTREETVLAGYLRESEELAGGIAEQSCGRQRKVDLLEEQNNKLKEALMAATGTWIPYPPNHYNRSTAPFNALHEAAGSPFAIPPPGSSPPPNPPSATPNMQSRPSFGGSNMMPPGAPTMSASRPNFEGGSMTTLGSFTGTYNSGSSINMAAPASMNGQPTPMATPSPTVTPSPTTTQSFRSSFDIPLRPSRQLPVEQHVFCEYCGRGGNECSGGANCHWYHYGRRYEAGWRLQDLLTMSSSVTRMGHWYIRIISVAACSIWEKGVWYIQ
jgi:hypothetical protein